jgi:hypothetical protein
MGEAFIVRRGGVAEEVLRTATPDINFVSKTFDEIVVTFKNNDTTEAEIFYGLTAPLTDSVVLADDTTSSNITFSGLDGNTQYTISAYAIVTNATLKKIKSEVVSTQITTEVLPVYQGDRAVVSFGELTGAGSYTNIMDFITITTTGNATTFGNMSQTGSGAGAASNGSRGLFAGGSRFNQAVFNNIEFITIGTTGNTSSFGALTQGRFTMGGISNETRGIFGGGATTTPGGTPSSVIDFVTIATTGNATSFGSLIAANSTLASTQDFTRGVFAGGFESAATDRIQFITIDTTGNATSFGNLSNPKRLFDGGGSNNTRGLFAGGFTTTFVNTIEFITIATTGNATNFGNLTQARRNLTSTSNTTRMVSAGGNTGSIVNTIDFVEMATTGNATSFGSLTVSRQELGSLSGN